MRLGVITIGWSGMPGLGDLRDVDDEEVLRLLADAGRRQPRADRKELLSFRDGIAVGDVVVTPDGARAEILLGAVVGDYEYAREPVAGTHRHVRRVRWSGSVPREGLPLHLWHPLRYWQRTVLRLANPDDWAPLAADRR